MSAKRMRLKKMQISPFGIRWYRFGFRLDFCEPNKAVEFELSREDAQKMLAALSAALSQKPPRPTLKIVKS